MPNLDSLKGKRVIAILKNPMFRDAPDNEVSIVRLISIESGGLWIESHAMTKRVLKHSGQGALPVTPVFFVPFSEIIALCDLADYPALSEESLGLEPEK